MSLEFNSDKELIKSSSLEVNATNDYKVSVGSGNTKKVSIFSKLTDDLDQLVRVGINTIKSTI
jgi:hypothetical protein